MTKELFRNDAYAKSCEARVLRCHDVGIELDRTVFYYESGGQPGDTGTFVTTAGTVVDIVDTQMDKSLKRLLHIPAAGAVILSPGDVITASIDWDRRYRLMRMHSALHLLCAVVDAPITGAKVGFEKSRIDFNPDGAMIDKVSIQKAVDELIDSDLPLSVRWISEKELTDQPELVRTMSVRPPTGVNSVRLIEIQGTDLQPCGGTHVVSTGEIGKLIIGKVENKGRLNRRINVRLED